MSNPTNTGGQLHGIIAILILIISTTIFFMPILFIGIFKLIPIMSWQVACTKVIDRIGTGWVAANSFYIDKTQHITWHITGMKKFDYNNWHLVVANHQSWLDIVVLQKLFHGKIPMLKFFIKDQLKWVPLLGYAWWAMGCPFMKRYSKEYLEQHPDKRGKDMKATLKALELFKQTPSAIINFVEGTRFNQDKKTLQESPYQYLLKPKAGGIGFVIGAMGNRIHQLIDVSITYPSEQHSLWDFLCHRINKITIHVREIPIPTQFMNPQLVDDEQTQLEFREWLNEQWSEKDKLIGNHLTCVIA